MDRETPDWPEGALHTIREALEELWAAHERTFGDGTTCPLAIKTRKSLALIDAILAEVPEDLIMALDLSACMADGEADPVEDAARLMATIAGRE